MRKIIYSITLIIFCFSIFTSCDPKNEVETSANYEIAVDSVKIPDPTIDEIIKNGIPKDSRNMQTDTVYETDTYYVIEETVSSGQTVSHILQKYNISHSEIYKLEKVSEGIFNLTTIKHGNPYSVICAKDSVSIAKCLIYEKSKTEYVVFDFRDSIRVYKGEKEITKRENFISASIKEGGSLWNSLDEKLDENKRGPLVMMLANNIYAWTIDFNRLQSKDSFIVYFEEKYVGEKFVDIGKIFAVSFTHRGKTLNAFRFKEQEKFVDYFDENGNNLRKAFLKTPIAFDFRISSNFGKRKHPISGKWKTHFGTDYAAPTGTPIMSTAHGTIEFAGRKGGYGNCVIVRHNSTYTTLYAHMSKIKSGIQKGSYVQQSDVIGFVGSTGYATGPHLHYEFFVNGKQVDPYKQDLPAADPLNPDKKSDFEKVKNNYLQKISENQNKDIL